MNSGNGRSCGAWVLVRSLVRALVLSVMIPLPAFGQVTFEWGTIRHDTLYPTVEHCLGLMRRFERREYEQDTIYRDTLPPPFQVAPNSRPPDVIAAVRRCSDKFTVNSLLASDSIDVNLTLNAFRLLYTAGRVADAIQLAEGAIAKIPAARDTLRQMLRTDMAKHALETLPTDFPAIRRLADSMEQRQFWLEQIYFYGKLMFRAQELRDTMALNSIVTWLVQTPSLLGDSIIKLPIWLYGPRSSFVAYSLSPPGHLARSAKQYMQREMLLAKLEESTAAYHEAIRVLNKEVGYSFDDPGLGIAKPIDAAYWFPDAPSGSRPTLGKISYILLLRGNNVCSEVCGFHAWMRRIAAQFPDVEYTLLARTWGAYGWESGGSLSMPDEARIVDSVHRRVWGFPGRVAVMKGNSWRLSEPDGRVIDEALPNEKQYITLPPFGIRNAGGTDARLVDRTGTFVLPASLALTKEESLVLMLRALHRQPTP